MTPSEIDRAVPARIILSRKGFDSTAGKYPSPIVGGQLFSLPIPENAAHQGQMYYSDLGYQGALGVPQRLLTSRRTRVLHEPVHLDPDIRSALRPKSAQRACSPKMLLFGQDDTPQRHLMNCGVAPDDLFLFWGWFREAVYRGTDIQFVPGAPDLHVLWGWLQVGSVHHIPPNGPIPAALSSAGHHPHLACLDRPWNCIYKARGQLTFNSRLAGAGIFNPYSPVLRLTKAEERRRSIWSLPGFFCKSSPTHLRCDEWQRLDGTISGKTPGRGQEFVFQTAPIQSEVKHWLDTIFANAERATSK